MRTRPSSSTAFAATTVAFVGRSDGARDGARDDGAGDDGAADNTTTLWGAGSADGATVGARDGRGVGRGVGAWQFDASHSSHELS